MFVTPGDAFYATGSSLPLTGSSLPLCDRLVTPGALTRSQATWPAARHSARRRRGHHALAAPAARGRHLAEWAAPRRRDGHLCGAALGGDGGCAEWQEALALSTTASPTSSTAGPSASPQAIETGSPAASGFARAVEDLLDLGLEGVEAEDANELRNLDLAVPVLVPLLEQLDHACSERWYASLSANLMNSAILISSLPSRSMALKRLRSASSVWMAISRSRTIPENSRKSRLRLRSLSWASMSMATLRLMHANRKDNGSSIMIHCA
jgi:hypothetical protein